MYHVIVEFTTNIVEVDFRYLSQAKDCMQQVMKFDEFVKGEINEIEENKK